MICRRPTWRGSDVISALVCVPADPETAGQFSSKLLAYCQQHGKLQKRSLQNYWLIAYPVTWQLQKKKAVEEEEEETGDKKKEEEEEEETTKKNEKEKGGGGERQAEEANNN